MNTSGFMERLSGCATMIQCSVWDILTDKEEDQLLNMIREISERFPRHDVKITVEVRERRQKHEWN